MGFFNSSNAEQTEFKEDLCCRSKNSLHKRKQTVLISVRLGRELEEREQRKQPLVGIPLSTLIDGRPLGACARGWPGPQRPRAALSSHPYRVTVLG